MKKLLLSLLIFGVGMGAGAQVNIFEYSDPGTSLNGTVINVTVEQANQEVKLKCVNNTGVSQDMTFRRVILSSSTTFSDQFCDNSLCYPCSGNDWTTPNATTIANGDTSDMKPSFNFSVGGDALVRYYALGTGGVAIDSVDIQITSVMSVEEDVEISFTSYPNPAADDFFINFNGNEGLSFNLVVYNVVGAEVMRRTLNNGSNKINVENLNNGVYFYSIVTNGEIIETKKLVVRH